MSTYFLPRSVAVKSRVTLSCLLSLRVVPRRTSHHPCNPQLAPPKPKMEGANEEEDFQALQTRITDALVAATRSTTRVCAEDLSFYRSLDPNIAVALDRQHGRILSIAERLLGNAAAGTNVPNPVLSDADSLETGWRGVVDVVDGLLEQTDTCLDEHEASLKRQETTSKEPAQPEAQSTPTISYRGKVPRNLDIPKPQKQFDHVPINNETDAFQPLLTSKPHALVPLEETLRQNPFNIQTGTEQYDPPFHSSKYKSTLRPIELLIKRYIRYDHPYKTEIGQYQYPEFVQTMADPIPYHDYDNTEATYVDTPEALDEMLRELKQAKEIAVDLEHHDMRSYIGIVCLMQISTRDRDWIVDTLKPWRRRLECLNEVFTDPKILKVCESCFLVVRCVTN